jgi:hypothetical protein
MKCFDDTIDKKLIVLFHSAAVAVVVAAVQVPVDTCSNKCDHRDALGRE